VKNFMGAAVGHAGEGVQVRMISSVRSTLPPSTL
jgi:hypothetical protein